MNKQSITKFYKGNQQQATEMFQRDAKKMNEQGYSPTVQTWVEGAYGCGTFLFALLLCVVVIGLVVFIYMIFVKPPGTLSVTYELRAAPLQDESFMRTDEKICPQCAEKIKAAAKVCRYCRHEFE